MGLENRRPHGLQGSNPCPSALPPNNYDVAVYAVQMAEEQLHPKMHPELTAGAPPGGRHPTWQSPPALPRLWGPYALKKILAGNRSGLFHVRLRRVAAGPQLTEPETSPIVK